MVYVKECFSSRGFIVSGLTVRSLIHFEFIFVYGVRKCSGFILLQVVDQFSQHHLLKRLFFSPLYILASFVKDKASKGVWIFLWAFYFELRSLASPVLAGGFFTTVPPAAIYSSVRNCGVLST